MILGFDGDLPYASGMCLHSLRICLARSMIVRGQCPHKGMPQLTMRSEVYDALVALDYDIHWQPNAYEPDGFIERVHPLELMGAIHMPVDCSSCGAVLLDKPRGADLRMWLGGRPDLGTCDKRVADTTVSAARCAAG